MTTSRDALLDLVADFVSAYLMVNTALEYDVGDYEYAGAVRAKTGKPIAHWTFDGAKATSVPYAEQRAVLYFHIDEANNRAVVVNPRGMLSGGGYIINGLDGEARTVWRS